MREVERRKDLENETNFSEVKFTAKGLEEANQENSVIRGRYRFDGGGEALHHTIPLSPPAVFWKPQYQSAVPVAHQGRHYLGEHSRARVHLIRHIVGVIVGNPKDWVGVFHCLWDKYSFWLAHNCVVFCGVYFICVLKLSKIGIVLGRVAVGVLFLRPSLLCLGGFWCRLYFKGLRGPSR